MPATVQNRVFTWLFLQIQTCIYLSLILYRERRTCPSHFADQNLAAILCAIQSKKQLVVDLCQFGSPSP